MKQFSTMLSTLLLLLNCIGVKSSLVDNEFIIRTADENTIRFKVLSKTVTARKLKDTTDYSVLSEDKLDLYRRAAYKFEDGNVLHLRFSDGNSLLFDNEEAYIRSIRGKNYYELRIFYEAPDKMYASFSLRPSLAGHYLKQAKKKLTEYEPIDKYEAFQLAEGAVCFIRNRIGDIYDGYWYPSVKDFEYCYKIMK